MDLFLAAFLWTSTLSVELGKNRPVMPLGLVNKTYINVLDWLPYGRFSYDEYDVPDTMNVHAEGIPEIFAVGSRCVRIVFWVLCRR